MKSYWILIAMLFMALNIASCKNYKKACEMTVGAKIDIFAVEVAKSCEGSEEKALEFFGKAKYTICGQKAAKLVKKRYPKYKEIKEEQALKVICPIILETVMYGGAMYIAQEIECKKPLEPGIMKDLASMFICGVFQEQPEIMQAWE